MMKYYIFVIAILIVSTTVLAEDVSILPVDEQPPEVIPDDAAAPEEPAAQPSIFSTILNLFLSKVSVISGELVRIQAHLSYENSSPIANEPIDFYVGDTKIATQRTGDTGSTTLEWDSSELPPGVYIVGIDYQANGQLQSSHAQEELIIQEQPSNFLTGAVIAEPSAAIQEEQECIQVPYEIQQPIIGSCTETYPTIVCDDYPINSSCHEATEDVTHTCVTGYETITQYKQECHTTVLIINNYFAIPTTTYACSAIEGDDLITVTCDSKYDGDGNGVCNSGESCVQYEIEVRE